MTQISLTDVTVDYPIYNARARSLRRGLTALATGGAIGARDDGVVVVRGLDGVTATFESGDRVGVVGSNGSGKTTFLRVLAGIYHPTGGSIEIEGKCTSLINIWLGMDLEATGRDNIIARGTFMGLTPRQISGLTDEVIAFSELGDFIDVPIRTYSTGMQLRLAFSMSTAVRPEILIMDEWLSTGDEGFQHRAQARLRDLVESTRILVLCSHSRELIRQNCTRVLWLDGGRLRMDGDADTVLAAYFDGTG